MAPSRRAVQADEDAGHPIRTLCHTAVRMHGLPCRVRHNPGDVTLHGYLPRDPCQPWAVGRDVRAARHALTASGPMNSSPEVEPRIDASAPFREPRRTPPPLRRDLGGRRRTRRRHRERRQRRGTRAVRPREGRPSTTAVPSRGARNARTRHPGLACRPRHSRRIARPVRRPGRRASRPPRAHPP